MYVHPVTLGKTYAHFVLKSDRLLGRPSEVQGLARARGDVWSYRYENQFCQWFQVEITKEQQVRSAGYGQPPECMGNDDIIIP